MAWAFTTLTIHGVDETYDKGRVAGCLSAPRYDSTCMHSLYGRVRKGKQSNEDDLQSTNGTAATMLTLPILPDSHFANSPFLT